MELNIADVMGKEIITGNPDDTVQSVAKKMKTYRISTVMITDADESLVGLCTERDITNKVVALGLPGTTLISQIMTKDIVSGTTDMTILEVTSLFSKHKIKKLPLLEGKKIAGIITQTDMVKIMSLRWTLKLDKISLDIMKIMKEEYGNIGPFMLMDQLQNKDCKDLCSMSDKEKDEFLESLMKNCFERNMSRQKQMKIRSKMRSLLHMTTTKNDAYEEMSAIDFLLGRPN